MKKVLMSMVLVAILVLSLVQTAFADAIIVSDNGNVLIDGQEMLFKGKATLLTEFLIQEENADLQISKLRSLSDFSGNKYTLIECEPTGYYILHNESGQYIEFSNESLSPYLDCQGELIYGGPTYYFTQATEDNAYLNIMDKETICINNSIVENEIQSYCAEMYMTISKQDRTIASYIADDSININSFKKILSATSIKSSTVDKTDYWVTMYKFWSLLS